MINRAFIAGALVAVVGVAAWWSLSGDEAHTPMELSPGVAGVGAGPAATTAQSGSMGTPMEANPNGPVTVADSMGLTLDAARLFELGFGGGLVVDRNTLASIEAVTNSMPNPPSAEDMARLERTLREGLPKDDAEKALKLFRDYRSYTHAMSHEMLPKGIPSTVEEAHKFFDEMDAVRRRHFDDATANALFGPDEGYARLTMVASLVEQDPKLTAEQKKEQIDALRAQLPPEKRSMIPDPSAPPAGGAASQPGA